MGKDERLYARFDIGMPEHPKVMLLSDAAFRVLIESTMYCRRQLTDGFLDERIAVKMWGREAVEELATNHAERPSFVKVDGGWQIRDYAEHQVTRADIERKREAGRAGGLAKATNAKQTASSDVAPATEVPEQKAGISLAKTETETKPEKETSTSNEVDTLRLSAAFDAAYGRWPKKVERRTALERFKVAAKKLGVDELTAHVIRFGDAYAATTEKQFVPALGVWLSRERWDDELPARSAPPPRQTAAQRNLSTVEHFRQKEMQEQAALDSTITTLQEVEA